MNNNAVIFHINHKHKKETTTTTTTTANTRTTTRTTTSTVHFYTTHMILTIMSPPREKKHVPFAVRAQLPCWLNFNARTLKSLA